MHIIAYKIVTWISLKAAEVGVKCRDQLIPPLLYGDDMVMLVKEMRL